MSNVVPFKPRRTDLFLETVEHHGTIRVGDRSLSCSTARNRDDDSSRYLVLEGQRAGFEILLCVATEHEGTLEYLRDAGVAILRTAEMAIHEFTSIDE